VKLSQEEEAAKVLADLARSLHAAYAPTPLWLYLLVLGGGLVLLTLHVVK